MDAHPSPEWGNQFLSLPSKAREAHQKLAKFEASKGLKKGNPYAISLEADDVATHWQAITEYGAYSIYVEVLAEGVEPILHNDDGGSFMARLTEDDLAKATRIASASGIDLPAIMKRWYPKPSVWQRLFRAREPS